ncbi:MAG: protein kinase [Chitinispirillaceae bacterium]|nr:protein kinase [Chitinispirillaceae bacterium]
MDEAIPSENRPLKTPDKGSIRIRNMLASIERTFLPVGSQIGKYRIIEEIDRGGMAVVYKALQLDLDREVALKVMPANITINRRFVERFLTEAHAVAKLNHPNIVNIHEVAVENNIYYLAMDYIPGKNLYYHLHYHKPKLVDVLEIVARLADALQYAHDQKIIHRDLKLNNVIMNDRLSPVLIDFGLAKALEKEDTGGGITRTGEIMGSPSYMAPERILGGLVDHRSDICSLGIMLYEMLTFKNPYLDQRNLHQTTMNVMEANPIPPRKLVPWLPVEIEAITLKAMSRDAVDRYQSMAAFKADINRYQRGDPVEARPPSKVAKVRRFIKQHWAQLVIGGLIIIFSGLFGLSMYLQSRREQSHWQLVYTEKFSGKTDHEEWSFFPDALENDTCWRLSDGELHGSSKTLSFIRLQRRFNRDIFIEFDIAADTADLFNAGLYLFGSHPDSGYRFFFNQNGSGTHGISFPGSNFIFRDVDPEEIPIFDVNHIVIERIQHAISYSINGVSVARVWDFLPPVGKTHEHIGFFVNGSSAVFDNIRIYRRAIPQAPSPTLIADRFLERGDFESALDEYRGLLVDFSDADITFEIMIKIADCLVRLKRLDEALEVLDKGIPVRNRDETLVARRYFLKGLVFSLGGKENEADSIYRRLATRYPASPVNIAAVSTALLRSYNAIDTGNPGFAFREINAMSDFYKRYPQLWGRLQLALADYYIDHLDLDSAFAVTKELLRFYTRDEETTAAAQIVQGTIYLHRGQKEKAKELFDLCITAHINVNHVWEGWMALADIYKYDFKYRDALTIYQKIHRESPPSTELNWMAAVEAADLIGRQNVVQRDSILRSVITGHHPFPVPRLIARFYVDSLRENEFKERWERFFPGDRSYLFYFARKAIMNNEQVVAGIYLNDLRRKLTKQRWDYFKVIKIINNIENW